jgi:hypothetical protein
MEQKIIINISPDLISKRKLVQATAVSVLPYEIDANTNTF